MQYIYKQPPTWFKRSFFSKGIVSGLKIRVHDRYLVWILPGICQNSFFKEHPNCKLMSKVSITFRPASDCLERCSQGPLKHLTLSWRSPLSYRNQSIALLCKSVDWFLYDHGLHHERFKTLETCNNN